MKNQKGVTLIALVITIIVLIILAAVSITEITDDDKGVVSKAKEAARVTEEASDEEDDDIREIIEYAESETTEPEASNPEEVITYTVTFSYKDSTGTTVTKTATVESGKAVATSDYPTVSNYEDSSYKYTFNNKWVTTVGGTTEANLSDVKSNVTVYASYDKELKSVICFVAGTKVLTEEGLVNIEDVTVGMMVYSYNEETKEVELKEVLNTFITPNAQKDMVKVTVNGKVIESTSKHEYYVVNEGWKYAFELEVGDRLLNSNGEEETVENVELNIFAGEYRTVYNMEVEDNHNYFVSEYNVLVHNAGSC